MFRFLIKLIFLLFIKFVTSAPVDIECDEVRANPLYVGQICTFKDLNNENDTIDYNFFSRSVRDPYTYTYRTNLANIKNMEFRSSILPSIPRRIFEKFEKLETLKMVYCHITEIPRFTFEHASYLAVLNLARNNITQLEKNSFSGTQVLLRIDLSGNYIDTIDPKAFNELANLKSLCLSSNKILTLDSEVFKYLKNLGVIKLDNNQLTSIPSDIFLGNQQIQEIDLNGNMFTEIQLTFFDNMPNILSFIDVSYNLLTKLSINCTTFSYMYDDPTNLYINASNNHLTSLDISPNFTVTHLLVGNNNISDLSNVNSHSKLKELDLSYNYLGKLSLSSFSGLSHLTYLNLESTFISGIDYGTFGHQTKLITLDISYNKLINIDLSMFASLSDLQSLYIDGNNLTTFDHIQLTETFPKLSLIGLQDNDFNCTALAKIVSELSRRQIQMDVVEETKITDKPNIKGIACTKDGDKPSWQVPIHHIHNHTDSTPHLVETVNHLITAVGALNVSLQQNFKTKDDIKEVREQLRQLMFDFYQMKSQVSSNQLAGLINATADTKEIKNMIDIINNITIDRQKLELDKVKQSLYELETKLKVGQEKVEDLLLRPKLEKQSDLTEQSNDTTDTATKAMITVVFLILVAFAIFKVHWYLRGKDRFSYNFRTRTNTVNTLHSSVEI